MKSLDYYEGIIDGLTRYTWWKDGVQYVGSRGTTLEAAIAEVKADQEKERAAFYARPITYSLPE